MGRGTDVDHAAGSAGRTPWITASGAELLAGASTPTAVVAGDGKSGATVGRVMIEGQPFIVKSVERHSDWITRLICDTEYWTFQIWRSGLMGDLPPEIDHTVVGMALEGDDDDSRLTILMRDVGDHLIPEGDQTVRADQHAALIDALSASSAHYWGWRDDLGLTPMTSRIRFFAPDNIVSELERPATPDEMPATLRVVDDGWHRLPERDPVLARLLADIHADPEPLAEALASTPQTFLHGDWKMGNLGVHPDGRVILLDWAYPGEGPCCWDLAWYLAVNRARLPETKEATIDRFRAALARRGIDTTGWFERQLGLSLLAMTACIGWEKAVGDDDELAWWSAAAQAGTGWL